VYDFIGYWTGDEGEEALRIAEGENSDLLILLCGARGRLAPKRATVELSHLLCCKASEQPSHPPLIANDRIAILIPKLLSEVKKYLENRKACR